MVSICLHRTGDLRNRRLPRRRLPPSWRTSTCSSSSRPGMARLRGFGTSSNNSSSISIEPGKSQPWAMLLAPGDLISDFESFPARPIGDRAAPSRCHSSGRPVTGSPSAPLPALNRARMSWNCGAPPLNRGDRTILALRYPAIQGIGPLAQRRQPGPALALDHDRHPLLRPVSPVPG